MKTAREAFEFWLQTPHQLNDPYDDPLSLGDVFLRFTRMIDEAGYALVSKVEANAFLGLATTRELIDEISARIEIHATGGLDYRTVGGEQFADNIPTTKSG